MNSVKKLFLIVAFMAMSGVCAFAQTTGMKIGAVHPDLKMKITRCEATGKTIFIDMVFENVGSNDVDLRLFGGHDDYSVAYDDEGNVYSGRVLVVKLGNSDRTHWSVAQTLPSGIPIKGQIQIEGVPESSTVLRRLDLALVADKWNLNKKSKITNIPISREGDD